MREFELFAPARSLGTSMAISGAAAFPFMGTGSGATSFRLALFNIRLDDWLWFPGRHEIAPFIWKPGSWYLAKQLLGLVDEKSTFINLSGGGHIENLAIHELLLRRCKFIVAIDGECDPKITCGSLLTLFNTHAAISLRTSTHRIPGNHTHRTNELRLVALFEILADRQ